jgi:hypothetical protein
MDQKDGGGLLRRHVSLEEGRKQNDECRKRTGAEGRVKS